jgi:alcohol dehydrogenase (cytochrome c)
VVGETVNVCPSAAGAKNWNQATFSPQSGLLYVPVLRFCNDLRVRSQPAKRGTICIGGSWRMAPAPNREHVSGIAAFDAVSGEKKWEYGYKYLIMSSVLSTAGGLVFAGDAEGEFFALDAETGEKL